MQLGRDTDPAVERWAGAGHSDDSDPAQAGREAVTAAISGRDPRLVLVFASPRYGLDALGQEAQQAAGPANLVGCSAAGQIGPAGATSRGVSAFALGGPGFSVATSACSLTETDPRAAGEKAARCLADVDAQLPHRALILLADGRAGDTEEIVRGAYSVAGATVSLVGGCAVGGPGNGQSRQLLGGQVLRGSLVSVALASAAPLGVGVRHGWRPRGEPLLVTASEGKRLHTLNDLPALDVYLDALGAPERARRDSAAFRRFALLHPLGVAGARGREALIRAVARADFESRSLQLIADVPAGTLAWPMEG